MSSGTKKPNGGKTLPRRLFSIESLKKQRSNSEDSVSSGTAHFRAQSSGSSNLLTLAEKIEEGTDPFGDGSAWTDNVVVQSPVDEENPSPFGDDVATPRPPKTPSTARPDPRQAKANIPPLNLGGALVASVDDGAPKSPSRRRWDTLRSHVLPSSSSIRSATPPPSLPDTPSTPVPSIPSRPSTPSRGYRFGQKRSMRHVVEQVRDVTHDEARRLTEEIRKACMMVRFGDMPARAQKSEPSIHNTLGSTLHLPFLASSSNLSMATSGSGGPGHGHSRQMTGGAGLKRPQSVMSLGASSRAAPTVTHIARALTSSTSVNRPKILPGETQVLAALLVPFLGPHRNEQIAVEQQTAVETFEYAIRTWKAASHEVCEATRFLLLKLY